MSARIRENKREIGTLRAVGADERAQTKSFINQMTSMFTLGIGIGFGLYILSFVVIKIIGISAKLLCNFFVNFIVNLFACINKKQVVF